MNRFYLLKPIALLIVLLGWSAGAFAVPITYNYTGGPSIPTYTVAAGVFSVTVDMQGGRGGDGNCSGIGGGGGRLQCSLAVTPGQVLYMIVGGRGQNYGGCCGTSWPGGYNGGGSGYQYGGGGGGASDIRINGTALSDRVLVAGGGGGGGYNCCSANGGAGGGLTGASASGGCGTTGGGGSQSAVGSGGTGGGLGQGSSMTTYGDGGGGGGYYGGGAGQYSGGGGGSSYVSANATSVTHTPGYNTSGNGIIIIDPICTPPSAGTGLAGPNLICGGPSFVPYATTGTSTGGTWTTNNPIVATISNTGVANFTGTAGVVTFSYPMVFSCGSANPTITVTVNPTPPAIGGPSTACTGNNITLTNGFTGTWSTCNPFIATVGSASGVVTGVSAGTTCISFTSTAGCSTFKTVTVNPTPVGIGGTPTVCLNGTTTLTNATPGGTWSSTNIINAPISPAGVVSGNGLGAYTISYTLGTGCYAARGVTVNPLPNVNNVLGGGSYCLGGTGANIGIDATQTGVSYQLYTAGTTYGSPFAGTGSAMSFGSFTPAGVYTVEATYTATGCESDMSGSATVNIDPLPTQYTLTVTGGGTICAGGTGVDLILSSSDLGHEYQLYNGGVAVGSPEFGSGSPINFGTFTTPGTYTVIATNIGTTCTNTMLGAPVLTVNALPAVFNVTGGGNYCQGGVGVHIGLNFSSPGISYQLYDGMTPIGPALAGSSSPIDFGLITNASSYTVIATNTITGCTNNMAGSATVVIDPLPTSALHNVTGSGNYCAGDSGVHIYMSLSDLGINYQLYHTGIPVGMPVPGNNGILDMGLQTLAGTYTVVGTNVFTGCVNNMTGSATIGINPLPAVYTLSSGAGSYCSGASGLNVVLPSSQLGVNYQLMLGASPVGAALTGTGSALNFGLQTAAGTYTAVATNNVTNCISVMNSAAISINSLPAQYNVTGGGFYCSGSTIPHVGIGFSSIGVSYQLYRGITPVGAALLGSSSSLDFGAQATPGVYSVVGTNVTTGCQNNMLNTVTITIASPPVSYILTASGSSYCNGDAGIDMQLSNSDMDVSYQLYYSGIPVGSPLAGAAGMLDFGFQTAPGVYYIIATDDISGCVSNMLGSAPVVVNPLPPVYTVTGGGTACAGASAVHVGLTGSNLGINYQLYINGTPAGSPMPGTGVALDFGVQTVGGTYTVSAANSITTCQSMMNGSANIIINPAPPAYAVTGGGAYCTGGTGFPVGLAGSDAGISYQLYNGASPVGASITGTGLSINYGIQSVAGTYTVLATNMGTGCNSNMTGSAPIVVNPLPASYTVFGGGTFCAGGAGAHVQLNNSNVGINYQLYNGASPVGSLISGTGTVMDFGPQATSGTYTIKGIDASTGCTSNMLTSVVVTVKPAPATHFLSGGGSYCSGGSGVAIGLDNSDWGISYQLYNGTSPVGAAISGAGIPVSFGLQTAAGSYSVIATDLVNACTSNMGGFASVTVTPSVVPSVTIATLAGDTMCNGAVTTLYAMPVFGGSSPSYAWKVNGTLVSTAISYSYVPVNGDLVTATLTSSAACASPVSSVSNSIVMTVRPYVIPAVSITAAPGNQVCIGTPVTLNATSVHGGSAPVYRWLKNSVFVNVGSSYTYTPANGDIFIALLESNYECRLTDTVYSNNISMVVDEPTIPTVSISADPGTSVGIGQKVTLTALAVNAGSNPSYQWYLNGSALAGETNPEYVNYGFADMDSVSCVVTTGGACAAVSSFNSATIRVRALGVKNVTNTGSDIRVMPNPNKGTFTIKGSLGTAADADVTIEITNMLGQVVYNNKVTAAQGNINERIQLNNNMASGMYILNLRSGNDNTVFHIVIEQ